MGVSVYGNDKEDMIVIADPLNPEKIQIRTYKRYEKNNLVTEKYKRQDSISENDRIEQTKEKQQEILEENTIKEEDVIKLIAYEEFIRLINLEFELTEEQKNQVNLWYQTIGDIYIYEAYLSEEILMYLNNYRKQMENFEILKTQGMINQNQTSALEKYYELTDPQVKNEKLANMSEERKIDIARKLVLKTSAESSKAGKVSLLAILSIILVSCIIIVYLISLMYK